MQTGKFNGDFSLEDLWRVDPLGLGFSKTQDRPKPQIMGESWLTPLTAKRANCFELSTRNQAQGG